MYHAEQRLRGAARLDIAAAVYEEEREGESERVVIIEVASCLRSLELACLSLCVRCAASPRLSLSFPAATHKEADTTQQ